MGQAQSAARAYDCNATIGPTAAAQDTSSAAFGWQKQKQQQHQQPISDRKHGRPSGGARKGATAAAAQIEHVRKLSIVSNRNIQLLSMKPRSERDNYADGLRARRRSSLINMILGAPSSGPRFSDDLCSLSSHMSDLCQNFGIDYFPDAAGGLQHQSSIAAIHRNGGGGGATGKMSSAFGSTSLMHLEEGALEAPTPYEQQCAEARQSSYGQHHRRRSSFGSLTSFGQLSAATVRKPEPDAGEAVGARAQTTDDVGASDVPPGESDRVEAADLPRTCWRRRPSLCPTLMASIDLTSSFDEAAEAQQQQASQHWPAARAKGPRRAPPLIGTKQATAGVQSRDSGESSSSQESRASLGARESAPKERHRHATVRRMLHRSGSELSLYSSISASSACLSHQQLFQHNPKALQHHSLPASARSSSRMSRLCCGPAPFVDKHGDSMKKAAPAKSEQRAGALARETKLIIMLQVCLPFILAGFGNMSAGLVLNKVAHWSSFQNVPIFFVLLPSFVGLKGNIEMTLASRLSTLANLNLLTTSYQRRRAYLSNLVLILSQAIGLSLFAALASMLCELSMGLLEFSLSETLLVTALVVLPCALMTSMILVSISSIVTWWSVWLASLMRVNPDNLSTLLAATYGDVSCVLAYGLFAELMYSCHQQQILIWPLLIVCTALISWPALWYAAFKFRETRELSLASMPPMLTGIMVSLGSGSVLSLVVGRYSRIALYQPVVNGFGANLIAVQASRVSTWLWCGALRRLSSASSAPESLTSDARARLASTKGSPSARLGASLASFTSEPPLSKGAILETNKNKKKKEGGMVDAEGPPSSSSGSSFGGLLRLALALLSRAAGLAAAGIKLLLWSFLNASPNSVAARLLLIMMIPAHTLYFFVIWLLSPANYVALTWPFYAAYIALCLTQVSILLLICEPLMTLLMRRHLDPDIFGISLLMALADLVGTLCLTAAFWLLARLGDPNAF